MNVEIRSTETAAERAASAQFAERAESLPGSPAVQEARKAAMRRFVASGLPHRRMEDWKYTDLRALLRELPDPATPSAVPIGVETLADVEAWRIVIVDGGAPRLPDDLAAQGVSVVPLEAALADGAADGDVLPQWPEEAQSAVLDLNTAFMRSGVVVKIPAGVELDRPIQIACVTTAPTAAAVYLRNSIEVADGAAATVVESYEGPDGVGYVINTASRLSVGKDAALTWIKVQRDGDAAVHLSTTQAELADRSRFVCAPFTTGGVLSRNQLALVVAGEPATVQLAGVQLLGGRQHGDTTMFVDHAMPHGTSRELFKSVVDGRGRAVFQGKIVVRPGAQKTDARMMTQALMLSERAEADNKPELEIYADDVQCGHGATSGRINEQLLFYLRARGIPEIEAKALLIEAFVGEAIEAIGEEAIGGALAALVHEWVAEHAGKEA